MADGVKSVDLSWAFVRAVERFQELAAAGNAADRESLMAAADEVLLAGQRVPIENLDSLETDLVLTDINETRRYMQAAGVEMLETPRTNNAGGLTFRPSV